MDNTIDSTIDTTKERLGVLEKAPASHVSFVLNGMGNGATFAVVPFAAVELGSKLFNKPLNPSLQKNMMVGGVFATIVGTVVGGLFGAREAHDLKTYQSAVGAEIRKLRADVDAHANKNAQAAR